MVSNLINTNKKNLMLIFPPFRGLKFGKDWQRLDAIGPPLGLSYLAGPLIKAGHNLTYYDGNVEKITEAELRHRLKQTDALLISVFSDNYYSAQDIIKIAKQENPQIKILCGGPYAKQTGQHVEGANLTLIGEAENCINKAVEKLFSGKYKDMEGLRWKDKSGKVHGNGFLINPDLNSSKSAAKFLTTKREYGYFNNMKIKGMVGAMTSRGCPYSCNYCTHKGTFEAKTVRKRSIQNVLDEFEQIEKDGGRLIVLYDENFLMDKERVKAIANGIIARKLKLKFILQGRADNPDPKFYRLLRKAGVMMIMFGLESASQDVLNFYEKGNTLQRMTDTLKASNSAGIINFGYFILGAPIETRAHFIRLQKFLRKEPVDVVNVNILGYYKGSKLWHNAVDSGKIREHETTVYANESLSKLPYLKWLKKREQLLKGVYYSPKRLLRIAIKLAKMGILPEVMRILWAGRKGIMERSKAAFFFEQEEDEIVI